MWLKEGHDNCVVNDNIYTIQQVDKNREAGKLHWPIFLSVKLICIEDLRRKICTDCPILSKLES